jgi:ATP-dependent 26S proteasome regulatory subunit
MGSLASPEFINFMGNLDSNTILLIEDAEEILKPRTEGSSNGAISNLLNMTDGILGDCFAIKIFASFNSSLDKIDTALLRKGRLVSKYEFKALSAEKTEALIAKLNLKNIQTGSNKCMTLSEIYNNDSEDYTVEKKTKPGFHLRLESEFEEVEEDKACGAQSSN